MAALIVPGIAAIQIQHRVDAAPAAQAEIPQPQTVRTANESPSESRFLHGRVIDPDGRPFEGALLSVPFENSRGNAFLSKERSGPDGRFRFGLTRREFLDCSYDPFREIRVAASADGFGLGWDSISGRDAKFSAEAELTLRLVKDVPIEERILNLEGKPVAGARLTVDFIKAFPGEDISSYIEGVRSGLGYEDSTRTWFRGPPGRPDPITTDERGRFHLAAVGRERLVRFQVEGPGIQAWNIFAATRRPATVAEVVLAKPTSQSEIYCATSITQPIPRGRSEGPSVRKEQAVLSPVRSSRPTRVRHSPGPRLMRWDGSSCWAIPNHPSITSSRLQPKDNLTFP